MLAFSLNCCLILFSVQGGEAERREVLVPKANAAVSVEPQCRLTFTCGINWRYNYEFALALSFLERWIILPFSPGEKQLKHNIPYKEMCKENFSFSFFFWVICETDLQPFHLRSVECQDS